MFRRYAYISSGMQQLKSELDTATKNLAEKSAKCDELSAENTKVMNLYDIILQHLFCRT